MPNSGNGPIPKIKIGSRTALTTAIITIIMLGVFASPVARIALFPTIGITTKTTPSNHGIIYSFIKVKFSFDAPIEKKMKSRFKKLKPAMNKIIKDTSDKLSVVKRFTFLVFPSPIALEITADAAIPIPKEKLIIVNVTGKVKLMATNSLSPIKLM